MKQTAAYQAISVKVLLGQPGGGKTLGDVARSYFGSLLFDGRGLQDRFGDESLRYAIPAGTILYPAAATPWAGTTDFQ